MKQLSVFIDESGDFAFGKQASEYYLITLVFHDQEEHMDNHLKIVDERIHRIAPNISAIHTGPLIRQKDEYSELPLDDRRDLLYSFHHFVRKLPIRYITISIKKKECDHHDDLVSRLSRELNRFIVSNLDYFVSYDQVVVYYDNGQQEIKNILNAVFSINLTSVVFRVVAKTEKLFFYKPQELKKQFLKEIHKKRI